MKNIRQIGVIGPAEASTEELVLAERVGALIAQRGGVVVCGGHGGVMEAACRGAKSLGGQTVGILMGLDKSQRNPYVDIAVATGLGQARNVIVVASSEVLIAVGGGYGTLSEIAVAMREKVRVIGLRTWEANSPRYPWAIEAAQTPEEAVELAFRQADGAPVKSLAMMAAHAGGDSPVRDVH